MRSLSFCYHRRASHGKGKTQETTNFAAAVLSLRASRATPDECVRGYITHGDYIIHVGADAPARAEAKSGCVGADAFARPAERSDA